MADPNMQFMMSRRAEVEKGKAIAIIVIASVIMFMGFAVMGMKGNGSGAVNHIVENSMVMIGLIVAFYVTIQLIGDGAYYIENEMPDGMDIEDDAKTIRIIYFIVGLFLCVLLAAYMYCKCSDMKMLLGIRRGSSVSSMMFGRRHRKRRG